MLQAQHLDIGRQAPAPLSSKNGGMLRRFFSANRRIAQAITPTHVHEANVFGAYRKIGAMLLSRPDVQTVVDVGAGKDWHFPLYYKDWYGIRLIGLDIDNLEMNQNEALDERVECDVSTRIPLADGSADLFMVNSGIEHFENNQRFLENALRVLRPGGYLIAQFPSRYAPFAVANRLLPPRLSHLLLNRTQGKRAEVLGFRAHYDRTDYLGFRKMFGTVGFEEIYHLPGYYSSSYCEFFLPLFALSYALDAVAFAAGISQLASYNLWVLRKPSPGMEEQPLRIYAWLDLCPELHQAGS